MSAKKQRVNPSNLGVVKTTHSLESALSPSFRKVSKNDDLEGYVIIIDGRPEVSKDIKSKRTSHHDRLARPKLIGTTRSDFTKSTKPRSERHGSTPLIMTSQLSNAHAQLNSPLELNKKKPEQTQSHLHIANGHSVSTYVQSKNPVVVNTRAASTSQPSITTARTNTSRGNRINYQSEQTSPKISVASSDGYQRKSNAIFDHSEVRGNNAISTDTVMRSKQGNYRNERVSMIPRAQPIIRPYAPYPQSNRALKVQWYPVREKVQDKSARKVGSVSTSHDPTFGEEKFTIMAKTSTPNSGKKESIGFTPKKNISMNNFPRVSVPVTNVPQSLLAAGRNGSRKTTTTMMTTSSTGGKASTSPNSPFENNRLTIIRENIADSTLNSELSDFEDEQPHYNRATNAASVLVYPKTLNEQPLNLPSDAVRWDGSDAKLTFLPAGNTRFADRIVTNPVEYNSTGNVNFIGLNDLDLPQYRQEYTSGVPITQPMLYFQTRHAKHLNRYKSTPDISNAGRFNSPLEFQSTSQDHPVNSYFGDAVGPYAGVGHSYGCSGSMAIIPNTIPETDYSEEDSEASFTPPDNSETHIRPDFRDPVEEEPSQGFGLDLEPNSDPVYAVLEQNNEYPRPSVNTGRLLSEGNFSFDTHESNRTFAVDHRHRGHQIAHLNRSNEVMRGPHRSRPDAMENFDVSFSQRRRSVNLPQDFHYYDPSWKKQFQTMEPDFINPPFNPQGKPMSASLSNQMHNASDDLRYVQVRPTNVREQQRLLGMSPYRRAGMTRPHPLTYLPQELGELRPRSMYDNWAMISPNSNVPAFHPSPASPHMSVNYAQAKSRNLNYHNTGRKTYSEWDISRVGLDDHNHNLHPDSYLHNRPNVRRGFGGNYTRTEARLPRFDLNRDSDRSHSLERPFIEPHSQVQSEAAHYPQVEIPLDEQSPRASSPTTSSISSHNNVRNRMEHSIHVSTSSYATVNTIGRPASQITIDVLSPLTITWREKRAEELQSDVKIKQLIEQLPKELQCTPAFVQLTMCINCVSNETPNQGLIARLRQALQLTAPKSSVASISKEDKPENGDSNHRNGENESRYLSSHNSDNECSANDSVDEGENYNQLTRKNGASSGHQTENRLVNGHLDNSDSNMPCSDDMVEDRIVDVPQTVPNILACIIHCLADRLAFKQLILREAQIRVETNASEKNWFRSKLNEVFVPGGRSSSTNLSHHSQTTLDSSENLFGNVVARFDRWHSNTLEVVKLLCLLSRRLAYVDAQILSLKLDKESDDCSHLDDTSQTLVYLQRQQHALEDQMREAQDLRANQEHGRIRLLESIPPGIKLDEPLPCRLSPPQNSSSENKTNENSAPSANRWSDSLLLLRDCVALHLSNTMKWLVTYHLLQTEVAMEEEIRDIIRDQQGSKNFH